MEIIISSKVHVEVITLCIIILYSAVAHYIAKVFLMSFDTYEMA